MLYITDTFKIFERLTESPHHYGLGINYFFNGHNTRIYDQYSARPLYTQSLERNGMLLKLLSIPKYSYNRNKTA